MDIAEEGKLRQLARDAADTRGPEDSMDDLLNWNNLTYTMPVTNSVVTARNLKSYKADQNTYTISSGQQILVTMQSGQQFVDWSNSFLEFDLELEKLDLFESSDTDPILGFFWAPPLLKSSGTTQSGTSTLTQVTQAVNVSGTAYNFLTDGTSITSTVTATADSKFSAYELSGHGGSVLNLIERVVLTSRSGVELQRIEDFNKLHALHSTIKKSKLWKQTVGKSIQLPPFDYDSVDLSGADATNDGKNFGQRNPNIKNSKTVHYSIPMECFMGLFDTKQLCPSMIASGLRIEFYLTDFSMAITVAKKPGTIGQVCSPVTAVTPHANAEYKIKNLQILTDTVTLNDAAMKQLNMTSAQNGLEYVYNGHFTQRYIATTSTVEIQCSKAVSRALFASAVHYRQPTAWTVFNMVGRPAAREITWTKHQWRLGSQYFPHQSIESKSIEEYSKLYYNILYATDTLNKNMQIDFQYKRDILQPSGPLPVVATFERSNLLRFSGVPINNSRTLSLSAEIDTSGARATQAGTVLLFLEYVMLSKAFLNNIVVSV